MQGGPCCCEGGPRDTPRIGSDIGTHKRAVHFEQFPLEIANEKNAKQNKKPKTTINEASVSDLIGYISLSAVRFSQTKQPHKPARRTNPHLTTTT